MKSCEPIHALETFETLKPKDMGRLTKSPMKIKRGNLFEPINQTHKTCYTDSKLKTALIPIVGKIHVCIAYKTYVGEKLTDLLHLQLITCTM